MSSLRVLMVSDVSPLTGEGGAEPYPSAAVLLEELDAAGAAVPANAAAWERFVRQVREQSLDSPLRRSA